jgi:REP element-mobilizing transposase RayT
VQRRKALRLPTYDYSNAGAYFVTVCVAGKQCLLGSVVDAHVDLSPCGAIVARHLRQLQSRLEVGVDCFVVMPNHVHAVLILRGDRTLGSVVGCFKAATAREINSHRRESHRAFWQRGFFDHVVRNDGDLERVREYVVSNPIRWSLGS